jgi:hypothetical protein
LSVEGVAVPSTVGAADERVGTGESKENFEAFKPLFSAALFEVGAGAANLEAFKSLFSAVLFGVEAGAANIEAFEPLFAAALFGVEAGAANIEVFKPLFSTVLFGVEAGAANIEAFEPLFAAALTGVGATVATCEAFNFSVAFFIEKPKLPPFVSGTKAFGAEGVVAEKANFEEFNPLFSEAFSIEKLKAPPLVTGTKEFGVDEVAGGSPHPGSMTGGVVFLGTEIPVKVPLGASTQLPSPVFLSPAANTNSGAFGAFRGTPASFFGALGASILRGAVGISLDMLLGPVGMTGSLGSDGGGTGGRITFGACSTISSSSSIVERLRVPSLITEGGGFDAWLVAAGG